MVRAGDHVGGLVDAADVAMAPKVFVCSDSYSGRGSALPSFMNFEALH